MAFFDFLSGADEAQKQAKKATREAINFQREGQEKAAGAVTQYLGPAANYGPAQSRLYDLSGLNGGQAMERAFGEFRESPQYNFLRQQGEGAAQRAAAAGGRLASGRTLADLDRFGQGLADQSYGDYYGRIRDLYGASLGAAGSLGGQLAGIYGNGGNNLANLAMQGGMQQAQYAGQRGGVLGDLLSQGIAAGSYIAGASLGAPGSAASSYGGSGASRNAYMPAYGPQRPY